jgi:hypothetical protein
VSPVAAQEAGHHDHAPGAHAGDRIGTVSFPNSGAPRRSGRSCGARLLHSFEYDDARTEFRQAESVEPGFAMAYWGEALTFAQLLWGLDYADSARTALARLAPTRDARLARAARSASACTARPSSAVRHDERRVARAQLRRRTAHAHEGAPDDLEARAFLAVGLLMDDSGTPAEQTARTEESIALAQSIFATAPQHPGGAHYLIHAADNPKYAAKGLAAARAYAKIAPDAEHALHMPSHIFVQVGAWDDVVSSNERAWPASRAWVKSHGVPNTELSFHSLWWLQYGYLQQGRFGAAKALLDTVRATLDGTDWATSDAIDARYAASQFRFLYAAETGDWSVFGGSAPAPAVANAKVTGDRAQFYARAETYRRAFVAAVLGDTALAKQVADSLPERATIARGEVAGLVAKAAATRRTGSPRSARRRSWTPRTLTSVRRAPFRRPSSTATPCSPSESRRRRPRRIDSSSS